MTSRIATAIVNRWIDGDTVVVGEMDLGWGVAIRDDPRRQTTHIRLAGVNCPDSRSNAPWYDPVLKASGVAYVNQAYPVGTPVMLISYELDDFGRSLARVVANLASGDVDVGADLATKGYARTGDYVAPVAES